MHRVLLGMTALIAVTLPATPALPQAFTGNPAARADTFRGSPPFRRDFGDLCLDRRDRGDRDGDRRHRRDFCRTDVVMDWYGGQWALYNNRSWAPDSYNDWWHDRPDRAYPRWVKHNSDCTPDRMWWSGKGWHC
jgi:hypothetical protein